MSTEMAIKAENALVMGDLGKLSADERLAYYKNVCESVGLNPLTRPFDYLVLNGKTVLYAKRDATDQLRKIHGVSVKITARERIEDVYVVTASATDKDGRSDESTGAVNVGNAKGDNLANALMKAETKAKRRVTLSICGLGLLDEAEVETIPNARQYEEQPKQLSAAKPATAKPITRESMIDGWKAKTFNGGDEFGTWINKAVARLSDIVQVKEDDTDMIDFVRTNAGMGEEQDWGDLRGPQLLLAKSSVVEWLESKQSKAVA